MVGYNGGIVKDIEIRGCIHIEKSSLTLTEFIIEFNSLLKSKGWIFNGIEKV